MAVQTLVDEEFGEITIHRIKTARHIKIGLHVNGQLRATMPPFAPKRLLRQLVHSSRESIRTLLAENSSTSMYQHGDAVGKTHSLLFTRGTQLGSKRQKNVIVITIPLRLEETAPAVQQLVREEVIKALRKEAKNYLPQRLAMIASEYGYTYKKVPTGILRPMITFSLRPCRCLLVH